MYYLLYLIPLIRYIAPYEIDAIIFIDMDLKTYRLGMYEFAEAE